MVETPQLGYATYVFAKPRSMEGFLGLYTRIAKENIRHNRDTSANRWDPWGVFSTALIRGHGLRRSDSAWGTKSISLLSLLTDVSTARTVSQSVIVECLFS